MFCAASTLFFYPRHYHKIQLSYTFCIQCPLIAKRRASSALKATSMVFPAAVNRLIGILASSEMVTMGRVGFPDSQEVVFASMGCLVGGFSDCKVMTVFAFMSCLVGGFSDREMMSVGAVGLFASGKVMAMSSVRKLARHEVMSMGRVGILASCEVVAMGRIGFTSRQEVVLASMGCLVGGFSDCKVMTVFAFMNCLVGGFSDREMVTMGGVGLLASCKMMFAATVR
jgi:hypothetical protein